MRLESEGIILVIDSHLVWTSGLSRPQVIIGRKSDEIIADQS